MTKRSKALKNSNQQQFRFIVILLIAFAVGGMIFSVIEKRNAAGGMSRSRFIQLLSDTNVEEVIISQNSQTPTGSVRIQFKDHSLSQDYYVSDVNSVIHYLEDKNIDYVIKDIEKGNTIADILVPLILTVAAAFFVLMLFQSRSSGASGSKMMNFGKSRARLSNTNKFNFKMVAGLNEEKEELEEVVDFLKNPAKYTALGARIPKGILLVGPPGTGKTLLAKAVAGEAKVPFFSISGSDFVEMFVGVGASRVRDLFEDAKRHAPCIIFIDEIDAVARHRGSGLGGSHDEREQTLNQLLVEMDGFGVNEGIIIMAATNRPDILDNAILRPGRFDRKITVSRPDIGGREEILKIHSKDKPLGSDIDIHEVAKGTSGFTGADLENLLNEAAILTAKSGRQFISKNDIDESYIKVGIGREKKSRIISEKERKITAYHEAGHAILFRQLPDVGPVHTISIIPTGMGAAGYTMPKPGEDEMFNSKNRLLDNIVVALGGRIAEEIKFNDITTGASSDIKQATMTARAMVMRYGMSEKLGFINYEGEEEILVSRDFGHEKIYSEKTSAMIDEEVRNIMETCYKKAKDIITRHIDVLEKCADLLLEKEKIGYEEFEALFDD